MKKITLLLSLLFTFSFGKLFSQSDTTGFTIPLEYVKSDTSFTQKDLYNKFVSWIAITYKSANNVIQSKDQESGSIIVKGGLTSVPITMGVPGNGMGHCTIEFKCKDGKFKMSFSQIYFQYYDKYNTIYTYEEFRNKVIDEKMGKKMALRYVKDVNAEIGSMYQSFLEYLKSNKVNNDW